MTDEQEDEIDAHKVERRAHNYTWWCNTCESGFDDPYENPVCTACGEPSAIHKVTESRWMDAGQRRRTTTLANSLPNPPPIPDEQADEIDREARALVDAVDKHTKTQRHKDTRRADMSKHTYSVEAHNGRGRWVPILPGEDKKRCEGYLWAIEDGPTPRLAYRILRSDGKVLHEIDAVDKVGIGMIAGHPTSAQYEFAADVAMKRAAQIRDENNRRVAKDLFR